MTPQPDQKDVLSLEANEIIETAKQGCVDRGVDPVSGKRGKCHVFIDGSNKCVCQDIDLNLERMK